MSRCALAVLATCIPFCQAQAADFFVTDTATFAVPGVRPPSGRVVPLTSMGIDGTRGVLFATSTGSMLASSSGGGAAPPGSTYVGAAPIVRANALGGSFDDRIVGPHGGQVVAIFGLSSGVGNQMSQGALQLIELKPNVSFNGQDPASWGTADGNLLGSYRLANPLSVENGASDPWSIRFAQSLNLDAQEVNQLAGGGQDASRLVFVEDGSGLLNSKGEAWAKANELGMLPELEGLALLLDPANQAARQGQAVSMSDSQLAILASIAQLALGGAPGARSGLAGLLGLLDPLLITNFGGALVPLLQVGATQVIAEPEPGTALVWSIVAAGALFTWHRRRSSGGGQTAGRRTAGHGDSPSNP